jgi:hypothetical protein
MPAKIYLIQSLHTTTRLPLRTPLLAPENRRVYSACTQYAAIIHEFGEARRVLGSQDVNYRMPTTEFRIDDGSLYTE